MVWFANETGIQLQKMAFLLTSLGFIRGDLLTARVLLMGTSSPPLCKLGSLSQTIFIHLPHAPTTLCLSKAKCAPFLQGGNMVSG